MNRPSMRSANTRASEALARRSTGVMRVPLAPPSEAAEGEGVEVVVDTDSEALAAKAR